MKKLIALTILLLATTSVAQNLEVNNEKGNAKIVEIGKLYAKGKLTPEQVREKIAEWRSSRTDVRNVDDNKRMRDASRGKQRESSEHIKHSRGFSKGTKGTDRRNHEPIRGDWKRLGKDRQPSKFDSKRNRISSRGQKLQYRPDFKQHREFRGSNQGNCGRCSKGTGKDRRIFRGPRASKQQSFRSDWSDRRTRGTGQRVRTVR